MQQKMMKYMMVFMAVMFYKVPSGLGIYFITSSLWQICERLLLPKVTHAAPVADAEQGGASDKGSGGNGRPSPKKPGSPKEGPAARGWLDDLKQRVEKIMDEARHDKTQRNVNGGARDDDRERNRPRPKPGKRR